MTQQIDFLFDFGSPNAYLVHKVVPAYETRLGATFVYRPILLGGLFKLTNNRSPIEAYAEIPSKLAYERLEVQRFVARHKLDAYRDNPHFPINTLHLMRGAVAARELGLFEAYVDAVFAAVWEQGLKMDDPAVIKRALDDAGLPADDIIAKTQDKAVKDALIAATNEAHARGAFGSPTFFLGDAMFFGKDKLDALAGEVERSRQTAA